MKNEKTANNLKKKQTKQQMGYIFKVYRESSNLTQGQVATSLGIDRSTYTYYETGKTEPTMKTLMDILRILKIPYDEFLNTVNIVDNQEIANFSDYKSNVSGKLDSLKNSSIYELQEDEQQLLINYRALKKEEKVNLLVNMSNMITKRKDKN